MPLSSPAYAQLWFRFNQGDTSFRRSACVHWFLIEGEFIEDWSTALYSDAIHNAYRTYAEWAYGDYPYRLSSIVLTGIPASSLFITDGVAYIEDLITDGLGTDDAAASLVGSSAVVIQRFSNYLYPFARGRYYHPCIPPYCVKDGKLNDTGVALYTAVANRLAENIDIPEIGITLVPAIWSKKNHTLTRLGKSVVKRELGHRIKREKFRPGTYSLTPIPL